MQIAVTAGHSMTDPGAVNSRLKVTEAGLVLSLRDQVANLLRARGFVVAEDGADGVNQPLTSAMKLVFGRLSVEFHFNAGVPSATGVEAFSLPALRPFAEMLCASVAKVLRSKVRGANGWKDQKESQHGKLGFINAGGVILEIAFISNDQDMVFYLANTALVARAIADAITAYLDKVKS